MLLLMLLLLLRLTSEVIIDNEKGSPKLKIKIDHVQNRSTRFLKSLNKKPWIMIVIIKVIYPLRCIFKNWVHSYFSLEPENWLSFNDNSASNGYFTLI